jgi:hypothetical protein
MDSRNSTGIERKIEKYMHETRNLARFHSVVYNEQKKPADCLDQASNSFAPNAEQKQSMFDKRADDLQVGYTYRRTIYANRCE